MTTLKPRLAIVVIAYNEEKYLGGCLESIANQTMPADEVIVVDNNSTDKTAEIAKSFPFVKLLREDTQGIAPARNRGFNETSCQLIGRIDADTHLDKTWVETAHKIMDKHVKSIAAVSGPANIYDMPAAAGRKLLANFFVTFAYFKASKLMLGHEALFGSNMILTQAAWQKVKNEVCNNSHEVHEDMDLALHIAKYGNVYYDKRLLASVSKRGFMAPLKKSIWRLRIWPKTVTTHRKLFARYQRPGKIG
jgi:glycosyltransferase involved in cell wall biosynthesis